MKKYLVWLAAGIMLVSSSAFAGDCNVPICMEQGGARLHVGSGGSMDVQSGGDLDVESGATFKIAGTTMSASAAELNATDGATAGTVVASKAIVVDANKDAAQVRNFGVDNLDAGLSGTAGTVDVFPGTASKGKIAITAADSAGDTTTTLVNASQAAARTYTIPDAGANASFMMTEGAQTLNGALTLAGGKIRTSFERVFNNEARIGATAGWVLGAIDTGVMGTVAASQTASTLVVPISGLHVGDTITGFTVHAQVESAANTVTIDGDLRNIDNTAADPVDASVGAITQVSVTADTAVAQAKTGLSHVVLATDSYYILLTVTTGVSTDVRLVLAYTIGYDSGALLTVENIWEGPCPPYWKSMSRPIPGRRIDTLRPFRLFPEVSPTTPDTPSHSRCT